MTPRLALLLTLLACLSCSGRDADVVLYCAVDRSHSEPIVKAFEEATGLKVDFQTDIEATKSVGHRRRLQEESNNPRCDVFWNNEVVQTVLLTDAGLLAPYDPPAAADIPERFRDPDRHWTGFGARGRIFIVNTEAFPDPATYPDSSEDFLDPAYKGRAGMAEPTAGTTATHGAWWVERDGLDGTFERLAAMRANEMRFGGGNAHLMRQVRAGDLDFGFTDTDDMYKAVIEGFPVAQVVPDQGEGEPGLLVIPNTVSLVKGAPHPEAARQLIDFLVSKEVEAMLAAGESVQIPVRADVPRPDHVLDLSKYRVAEVDWLAVGRRYGESVEALEAWFHE
jgi:iron(III) transport system substrate-binding protein